MIILVWEIWSEKRKNNPKSVTDLASEAGMSVANWYRIEAEKVEYLPKDTFDAIMYALGEDEATFLPKSNTN